MDFSYIGICDFFEKKQVLDMLSVFALGREEKEKLKRFRLMVGIMMSFKTLRERECKWTKAWAPKEQIAEIFVNHPLALNTLHYADYDDCSSSQEILDAAVFGGPFLQAVQFDMIWPAPELLFSLRENFPHLKIILQINSKSMERTENDPDFTSSALSQYNGALDIVLLDKSMGKGLGMDAKALLPYAKAIKNFWPDLGLAAAGGLGPNTMDLVRPLVEVFPDISIDAQGKLRPSGSALDPIDWNMAEEYLKKSFQMFA